MTESCFALEYTQTPEHLKEVYRFIYFRRPASLTVMIIICCTMLFHLSFNMMFFEVDSMDIILFTFLLLFILLRVLIYTITVRTAIKRQLEVCGGQFVQVHMEVYNDEFIQSDSSGAQRTISYGSIKRCYQTKNMFLLLSKANLVYSFPKDAFTKGLPEHFIPFIRSRGIKAK